MGNYGDEGGIATRTAANVQLEARQRRKYASNE
jgi:hypothetical protein